MYKNIYTYTIYILVQNVMSLQLMHVTVGALYVHQKNRWYVLECNIQDNILKVHYDPILLKFTARM